LPEENVISRRTRSPLTDNDRARRDARKRAREASDAKIEKLKDDAVERIRREQGDDSRHDPRRDRSRTAARWRRRFGGAVFIVALIGAWALAPRLGLIGDRVGDELADLRQQAQERVDQSTEDLLDDVSENVGFDVAPEAGDSTAVIEVAGTIDGWTLPLDEVDADRAARPHHDYPAWDYGIPVGTPIYAMTAGDVVFATADDGKRCGGTVSMVTTDGALQIAHCHLSDVEVQSGDRVRPGDLLGLSGGEPGAPGAGNTFGPHLHLQMRRDGQLVCPQAQLVALGQGVALKAEALPATDCFYSRSGFGNLQTESTPSDPFWAFDGSEQPELQGS